MANNDFLLPNLSQIRHSIRDIDDSYNNDWDLLAELCQNAIDAIRASDIKEGKIELDIDSINKSISIIDNGIGIDPNELPNLLKPFSSNKVNNEDAIGEKGVGLTYVMFSSNYFEIISRNQNGASRAVITQAYNWKISTDDSRLPLEHEIGDFDINGTKVILKEVADIKIFKLTFEQLKFVLLTRTALGNTLSMWIKDKDIDIDLKFRDQNNILHSEKIDFKYWLVTQNLNSDSYIDLDEFINYASVAERSDLDKRRKLKDKIIIKNGKKTFDNRDINYVACFVPTRDTWSRLTIASGLISEEDLANEDYLENFGYARLHEGITISIKGMPTGIPIEHPNTGYAGYWSNIFILFEDRKIKFDIGRKAINGALARTYRKFAKEIFNDFLKYVTKYVTGEVSMDVDWEKDEIFAQIGKIIDLDSEKINFRKCPKDQEASVAAIYFECLGKGYITDITPLISGYRNKYDLYAMWGDRKVVIDFKAKLRNVIRDFSDQQKMFDHLDCIVCWDVDEDDQQTFNNLAISLEPIRKNILASGEHYFPNSTHKLVLTNFVSPIYVIDLKQFLETLKT